jgi:hypothetical protein
MHAFLLLMADNDYELVIRLIGLRDARRKNKLI